LPFIVTDIQNNQYRIELQACKSKSNRIVKFVSIPSPNVVHSNL